MSAIGAGGRPRGSGLRSTRAARGLRGDVQEQALHLGHGVGEVGVVGEVAELAGVGLVVIKLHPALAALPLDVAISLGPDADAPDDRLLAASAADLGERG